MDLKAWTDGARKDGVIEERLDTPETQIRQLGHWDSSRMAQHYSTGLSKQATRMLTGHGPDLGTQFLEREGLEPPESLRRLIFPRLEGSQQQIFEPVVNRRDRAAQSFSHGLGMVSQRHSSGCSRVDGYISQVTDLDLSSFYHARFCFVSSGG